MIINGDNFECELQFSKPDNEGWMRTSVSVQVPNFSGSYSCTVEIVEFKMLIKALEELKDSIGRDHENTWGNMEANMEFGFRLQKLGKLVCSYKLSPNEFCIGPTLEGEFESDQTYIDGWLSQAQHVVDNAEEI